jgi:hypothetical protein
MRLTNTQITARIDIRIAAKDLAESGRETGWWGFYQTPTENRICRWS